MCAHQGAASLTAEEQQKHNIAIALQVYGAEPCHPGRKAPELDLETCGWFVCASWAIQSDAASVDLTIWVSLLMAGMAR